MIKELGWDSLECRRRDVRLALLGKIISGRAAVTTDILIKADSRTRSKHPYKLKHIQARTSAYKNSFFPRTIPEWNKLSTEAVSSALKPKAAVTSDPGHNSQAAAAANN